MMGIQVEFNPDLALRNYCEFEENRRHIDECIPPTIMKGKTYPFLKKGQRNYWLEGEIPLLETKGNQALSRPLASIKIVEATHLLIDGVPYTKGWYEVVEVYNIDSPEIHFESYAKLRKDK